jgi:hypothetical protein
MATSAEIQRHTVELSNLAKDLLKAWFSEKAVTNQAIKEQLGG